MWNWNDGASLPTVAAPAHPAPAALAPPCASLLAVGKIQTRYSPSSRLAGRAPRRPNPEVSLAGRTPEARGKYPLLESPETPHELPTWGTDMTDPVNGGEGARYPVFGFGVAFFPEQEQERDR